MINFTKMHGLGNDYIVVNNVEEKNKIEDISVATRYMCNRNFGIGADGVIVINKSKIADFKMSIYNKDGTEAQMCGNGIRCLIKYVFENKLIDKKEIKVETLSGIKTAYIHTSRMNKNIDEITVDMGVPIFDEKQIPVISDEVYENGLVKLKLKILNNDITVYCISVGNPHAIVFSNNIEEIDIDKFGKIIESDIHFPQKTNVEFVKVTGSSSIKLRVWERGVGETYACGTGACAAAVVCNVLGLVRKNCRVNLKGGDLNISWEKDTNKLYLTGIATKVFDGNIEIN